MLRESLDRFVTAAYSNVGTNRALCGIVVGSFFIILGTVGPLVSSIIAGHSRWLRLTAFPGLWFGLTVLMASLHGICLSVYLFGDVRQLHKFEMDRPPIASSKEKNSLSRPTSGIPAPVLPPKPHIPAYIDVPGPLQLKIYQPGPIDPCPPSRRCSSHFTREDDDDFDKHSRNGSYSSSIFISPEYYDENPIEGPATSPVDGVYIHGLQTLPKRSNYSLMATATFIHPYHGVYSDDSEYSDEEVEGDSSEEGYVAVRRLLPHELQPVTAFDFDALPTRPRTATSTSGAVAVPLPIAPAPVAIRPESPVLPRFSEQTVESFTIAPNAFAPTPRTYTPKALLGRFQHLRSSIQKWNVTPAGSSQEKELMLPAEKQYSKMQQRIRKAVPAFATPLTRVLSPVVKRGQWEIVFRSFIWALLITWIFIGSLLAVPVARK